MLPSKSLDDPKMHLMVYSTVCNCGRKFALLADYSATVKTTRNCRGRENGGRWPSGSRNRRAARSSMSPLNATQFRSVSPSFTQFHARQTLSIIRIQSLGFSSLSLFWIIAGELSLLRQIFMSCHRMDLLDSLSSPIESTDYAHWTANHGGPIISKRQNHFFLSSLVMIFKIDCLSLFECQPDIVKSKVRDRL